MKIKVRVTQEIIDRALEEKAQCNSHRCVIARALQEALGTEHVSVGVEDFTVYYPPRFPKLFAFHQGVLPREAMKIREAFDHDRPVVPTEFEIEKPEAGNLAI